MSGVISVLDSMTLSLMRAVSRRANKVFTAISLAAVAKRLVCAKYTASAFFRLVPQPLIYMIWGISRESECGR